MASRANDRVFTDGPSVPRSVSLVFAQEKSGREGAFFRATTGQHAGARGGGPSINNASSLSSLCEQAPPSTIPPDPPLYVWRVVIVEGRAATKASTAMSIAAPTSDGVRKKSYAAVAVTASRAPTTVVTRKRVRHQPGEGQVRFDHHYPTLTTTTSTTSPAAVTSHVQPSIPEHSSSNGGGAKESAVASSALHAEGLVEIPFTSGYTEITSGVLHLLRAPQPVRLEEIKTATVAVLAVPNEFGFSDLLSLLDLVRPEVEQIRILRDPSPSRFIALITFRETRNATHFYKAHHGHRFHSMAPETIHVVFVESVDYATPTDDMYASRCLHCSPVS